MDNNDTPDLDTGQVIQVSLSSVARLFALSDARLADHPSPP